MNAPENQKRNTEPNEEAIPTASDAGGAAVKEEPAVPDVSASPVHARQPLRLPQLLSIAVIVILLDQITKSMVASSMYLHESHILIPRILSIMRIHNTGIAFGLFPGVPDVLMFVTLFSILVVFYFYVTLEHRSVWMSLGCGLILGGAVGNLLDRFRLGYVVDFINFSFWPAFNVADSSVSVGVALLMIGFFLAEKMAKKNASDTV